MQNELASPIMEYGVTVNSCSQYLQPKELSGVCNGQKKNCLVWYGYA